MEYRLDPRASTSKPAAVPALTLTATPHFKFGYHPRPTMCVTLSITRLGNLFVSAPSASNVIDEPPPERIRTNVRPVRRHTRRCCRRVVSWGRCVLGHVYDAGCNSGRWNVPVSEVNRWTRLPVRTARVGPRKELGNASLFPALFRYSLFLGVVLYVL